MVPPENAIADYVASARLIAGVARYVVVNVSSPNTPGLRDLQAVSSLRPLLTAVREALDDAVHGVPGARSGTAGDPEGETGAGAARPVIRKARPVRGAARPVIRKVSNPGVTRRVPLLIKIAPDLADGDVDAIADLAVELGLDGIIATNTTIARPGLASDPAEVAAAGAGGLSGAPLRPRALEALRRLHTRAGGRVLIAAGGIETADDAWARIAAGATLVQAYTGFIYGGPRWPRRRFEDDLARRARAAGLTSISEAREPRWRRALRPASPADRRGRPGCGRAPRPGPIPPRRPAGSGRSRRGTRSRFRCRTGRGPTGSTPISAGTGSAPDAGRSGADGAERLHASPDLDVSHLQYHAIAEPAGAKSHWSAIQQTRRWGHTGYSGRRRVSWAGGGRRGRGRRGRRWPTGRRSGVVPGRACHQQRP